MASCIFLHLKKKGINTMNTLKKMDLIFNILAPIAILAIFIILTISVHSALDDEIDDTPEIYTAEEFADAIENGSGIYLVEGNMIVENAVISDDIGGEYIYFIKESLTKTQSFFSSWQVTDTEIQLCDNIIFLGVEIPASLFVSLVDNIESIRITDYTRYKYYGVEVMDYGALEITIENGSIVSVDGIYPNINASNAKDTLKDDHELGLIFVFGIIALFVCIYIFIKPTPDFRYS